MSRCVWIQWIYKVRKYCKQICALSPEVFNLYSEIIPGDLEDLHLFIIGGYNLTQHKLCKGHSVESRHESKLHEFPWKAVKERETNRLNINCNKTKWMLVSKRNRSKSELWIRDSKINQGRKFKYLGNELKEGVICETEIWKCSEREKYIF